MSEQEQKEPKIDQASVQFQVDPYFMVEGFQKLDDKYIDNRPPRIRFGRKYHQMPTDRKIAYLEKLAHTMNHAAGLACQDRNELGRLCELKENQLIALQNNTTQNTHTMQQQLIEMNEERAKTNETIAQLKARIRELENGNIG